MRNRIKVTHKHLDAPDGAVLNGMERVDDVWERQEHIDWVICGGESGHNARPMNPAWVRSLRDQCQAASVPFHFKQWGEWAEAGISYTTPLQGMVGPFTDSNNKVQCLIGDGVSGAHVRLERIGKKAAGCLINGSEWKEFPR